MAESGNKPVRAIMIEGVREVAANAETKPRSQVIPARRRNYG